MTDKTFTDWLEDNGYEYYCDKSKGIEYWENNSTICGTKKLYNWYIASKNQMKDKIVKEVIDKFKQRSNVGIEKYGVTLERGDLNYIEWLTHLQEELMDATLYVQKLKSELEQNPNFPDGHIITKESWDNADKITQDGFVYVKFNDLTFYK